jgi:hypothetical protein
VADRKSARADLRQTRAGLTGSKCDVQLIREILREEREQHDRSRVLMGEEERRAQMSEGRSVRGGVEKKRRRGSRREGARGWSCRVEWAEGESE